MNAPVLALERYADALTSLAAYRAIVAQGPLTGQSAAVLRTGLEQIDALLDEGRSLGLEAYGTTPRNARVSVTVSVEDLGEKAKGLVEKAKAWFAKFMAWLKEMDAKFTQFNAQAIVKGSKIVDNLLDFVKGSITEQPKEAKLTLDTPNYLMSGTEFIGHNELLERKIINWINVQHSPAVIKTLQGVQQLLRTYDYTQGSVDDFMEQAQQLLEQNAPTKVSWDLGYLHFELDGLTIKETRTENGTSPTTVTVRPVRTLVKFSQDCLTMMKEVAEIKPDEAVQKELQKIHDLENNTSATMEEAQLRMQCEVQVLGMLQGVVNNGHGALLGAVTNSLENKLFLCRREASQYSQKAQQQLRSA